MPKDFQLQLSNPPNGIYFPGSTISGTLLLTTDEAKEYKAIQVSLSGSSHVRWSERRSTGSGRNRRRRTEHYDSREEYLDLVTVVWDKNQHGSGGKLPPGSHQWPFTLVLQAPNIPPSYEDTVGRIQYTIAAKIVKDALLKFDTKAEAKLTVGNVVPVNRPDLLQPQALSVEKTLCCLCCASAPISITARISRTGYCIQQDAISVEVEVENGSNREVRNLTAIIKQIVMYTVKGHRKYSYKTIANVPPSDLIPARSTQVWKPSPLQVPFTETSITTCSNICLSYVLEVSASISGAINPKIDFPIVLGNVPLPGASDGSSVEPPAGVYPGAPTPNGGPYPGPSATENISNGQPLGFNGVAQTATGSKPSSQSAQLPPGFIDPIKKA